MTTFTYLLDLEKSIDPGMENKIKKYELKKKKMQAKILIDPEIFKKGLKDFGTTYDNYNHAYLGLNISGKELISVGGITNYKYLQKVDVSNNDLATLEQLSGLNHLTELNASHNKIEEIMDFDPPQNLEKVNYSFNLIQVIQNIEKNPFLKVLILSNNNISKIDGLSTCEFLEELDLSNNHIENIENLDPLGSCLTKLNLSSNKIKKISGLDNLTTLMELNLCQNEISRLKGLQGLENLRYLYLSSNKLSRCNQVAYLADLPFLTDLDFCFNDVQHKKFYRYQILYYIPQLRILDGQDVTHFEKVKADILFGADLENKKEIFNAYLPEEEFVDRRLFVAEQIDPESDSEGERLEDGEVTKVKGRGGINYSKNNATMSSIDKNGTINQRMEATDEMMASNQIKIDPFTY
jgi:Leucine-rich repeat (LRR) protein